MSCRQSELLFLALSVGLSQCFSSTGSSFLPIQSLQGILLVPVQGRRHSPEDCMARELREEEQQSVEDSGRGAVATAAAESEGML
jgi:hypothetical protein